MHRARKRFGQNFLQDNGIIYSIVALINPSADMHVIEIGPGLGALTLASGQTLTGGGTVTGKARDPAPAGRNHAAPGNAPAKTTGWRGPHASRDPATAGPRR